MRPRRSRRVAWAKRTRRAARGREAQSFICWRIDWFVIVFDFVLSVMVQCFRCPHLSSNLRLPLWCGLGFGLSKGSLFYLLEVLVLGVINPFFLSIALSAAFWNFCPSRKGCSVTSSEGIRTMPSLSRNFFPSSPNSSTNTSYGVLSLSDGRG